MTNQIHFIIFDMDGVIWKEDTPLTDLSKIFSQLKNDGVTYAFATNNSTKTPIDYTRKLKCFGVDVSEDQIITSGITLANKVKEDFPEGGPVYVVGEKGLKDPLLERGFTFQEDNVIAVIGGLDREISYQKLTRATLNIANGAGFYFSNSDSSFPSPQGNVPGAGSILASLETATNKKAIVTGKPNPYMFFQLMKKHNFSAEETLIIGDRLETDILGGKKAGCWTALVLSGISQENDLQRTDQRPDLVFDNIAVLVEKMNARNWKL